MKEVCFTHILHRVRDCVIPDQHLKVHGDDPHYVQRFDKDLGEYVDTDRLCTGCLPKRAAVGLLCSSCFNRFQQALSDLPALVEHLRSIHRAVQPDSLGVRLVTGWIIPIPGPWRTADDLLQSLGALPLRLNATPAQARAAARQATATIHAESRVTYDTGAELAIRFTHAVEVATIAYPEHEQPSKLRSSRCPVCAHRTLVYEPAEYEGASPTVRCLYPTCGHEMDHTSFERLALIEAQCCRRCRSDDGCTNTTCTCHRFAPVPEWERTNKGEFEEYNPRRREHIDLDPLTLIQVPRLRAIAEELDIPRYRQLRKPELIHAIRATET